MQIRSLQIHNSFSKDTGCSGVDEDLDYTIKEALELR